MQMMYAAMVNSPATTITAAHAFTADDTTLYVDDLAVFPAAPNIVVIGTGEDAVAYIYSAKSAASGAGTLTIPADAEEGTEKNWDVGTPVYRGFCAYDHDTFKANLIESPSDMARNAVVNGNFDVWQRPSTSIATTYRARATNVITVTTATDHYLVPGDKVIISGMGDSSYDNNDELVESTPTSTTFTANDTGTDETSTADTGGVIINVYRHTSINPANGAFTADRWAIKSAADSGTFPTLVHTQGTITPEALPGSFYCYKVTSTGAGTSLGDNSYYHLRHKIVGGTAALCGSGKQVTVSFQAKSSIANKKIGVYLEQNYGESVSDEDGSTAEYIVGDAWTLSSSWQRYTCTFTTNTLSGKTIYDDCPLCVRIALQWGVNYADEVGETVAETFVGAGDIEIAQVQVCAGNVALDYAPPHPSAELALCLFDYERFGATGKENSAISGGGVCSSATEAIMPLTYSRKRRHPSVATTYATKFELETAGTVLNPTDISDEWADYRSVRLIITVASGLTAGQSVALFGNGPSGMGYIQIYTGY